MENPIKAASPASPVKSSSLKDWFMDEFFPRYEKQLYAVIGAVVIALALYFLWNYNRGKNEIADNKKLGTAYVFLNEGKLPEAEKALTEALAQGLSGLARDKANLYLGKIYYDYQKYDQALEAYNKVGKGNKATILVYSGALHGKAACYMQKKDYAKAVATLDEFVSLCMLRTGNPKENVAGHEVVDLSPTVPNALWKEALCYRELGQPDKVKATVEKLQKVYPASLEARDGAKLLATVE